MSDLEHALALIEKEKLEKTGELSLQMNLNLEKLPNWIYELNKLQKLSCSFTKIDSLKPIIKIKRYTAGNTTEKSYHYPRKNSSYVFSLIKGNT